MLSRISRPVSRRHRSGIEFDGATAVVTGASSGIGRATALALADRGTNVVLAARSEEDLVAVRDDCRSRGADALAVPTDIGDEEQVLALRDRAIDEFGGFDAWINAAAVMAYGPFWELPAATFRRVVETNLFGTVHGSHAALAHYLDRGSGVLVNIDSLYGRITSPYVSPYVTSKFAVRGLTRCLRQETASMDGIDVCAILPEAIDTPIFDHAANHTGREITALPPAMDPDRVVRVILDTLEDPDPERIVGVAGRLMAWGEATAPGLYERLAHRFFQRVALRPTPVPHHDGNVFTPSPARNQVDGGWREDRRWARRGVAGVLVAAAALPTGALAVRSRRRG